MINTFGIPIIPPNDEERVNKLKTYSILDTESESPFNSLVELAANLFSVPIALVALVDKERVWFKANLGMPGVHNVDRGTSLCSLAILSDQLTVFNDATREPCLLANPLVAGQFGLKFYAGAPLKTKDGFNIGTICLVDKEPRAFNDSERKILENLASIAMEQLERRKEEINK